MFFSLNLVPILNGSNGDKYRMEEGIDRPCSMSKLQMAFRSRIRLLNAVDSGDGSIFGIIRLCRRTSYYLDGLDLRSYLLSIS